MIIEPNGSFSEISFQEIEQHITNAMAAFGYVDNFEAVNSKLALRAISKITRNNKDIERFHVDRMIRDTLIECGYSNVANSITNDMYADLPDEFIICKTHGIVRGNYDACPKCGNTKNGENKKIRKYKGTGVYPTDRPEPVDKGVSSGKSRILAALQSDREEIKKKERKKEAPEIKEKSEEKPEVQKENPKKETHSEITEKIKDIFKKTPEQKIKQPEIKQSEMKRQEIKPQASEHQEKKETSNITLDLNAAVTEPPKPEVKQFLFIIDDSTDKGKAIKENCGADVWNGIQESIKGLKAKIESDGLDVTIVDAFVDTELSSKYGISNVPALVVDRDGEAETIVNSVDIIKYWDS